MASQTQHQHQQQQSSYTSSSPSQPLINGSDESSITDTQSIVKQRIIHIPIGADESVHITSQSLSDTDATALLDILRTEITPLRVWIDIALLYSELGYWNRFEEILVEATQPQIQEKYVGQESDRIQVFNTLAAYYVRRAQSETDRERRNHYFTQANNMITAANRINNLDFRNFLGLGSVFTKYSFFCSFSFVTYITMINIMMMKIFSRLFVMVIAVVVMQEIFTSIRGTCLVQINNLTRR